MNNYEAIKQMTLAQMATLNYFAFGTRGKDGKVQAHVVGLDGKCYHSAQAVHEANLKYLTADAQERQPIEAILGEVDQMLKEIREQAPKEDKENS